MAISTAFWASPFSIAREIPPVATEILEREKELIELCRSPDFSLERLTEKIQHVSTAVSKPHENPK